MSRLKEGKAKNAEIREARVPYLNSTPQGLPPYFFTFVFFSGAVGKEEGEGAGGSAGPGRWSSRAGMRKFPLAHGSYSWQRWKPAHILCGEQSHMGPGPWTTEQRLRMD